MAWIVFALIWLMLACVCALGVGAIMRNIDGDGYDEDYD